MIESIRFTRHTDGSVTADRFPEEIEVHENFLAPAGPAADPAPFRVDGDRLYITAASGRATYVKDEGRKRAWIRLYGSMEPEA